MKHKWPLVQLGELLTERCERPREEDLMSGRMRIIQKITFDTGRIQFRSNSTTRTNMILVRPGDLVVSGINAAKGAIAIYDPDATEPVAATIHYAAYIPNSSRVDVRFLWWMLRSRFFQGLLNEYLPGGIKTELKPHRFLAIRVPLASMEDQRRIVARINDVATLVTKAQSLRKEVAALTEHLLESAIETRIHPEQAKGKMADVLAFGPRCGPSFVTDRSWTGTPVLMPSAVTGFGVDTSKVEYGIGTEHVNSQDRLQPGDILIARGNKRKQVGNAGVVPHSARGWVAANLLMRTRVMPHKADPYFVVYWLRSPTMRRVVLDSVSGTNPNIQKINQTKVLQFPFPTHLGVGEQRQIVAELDALQADVDRLKALQSATAAELDALLPATLERAFKGEL